MGLLVPSELRIRFRFGGGVFFFNFLPRALYSHPPLSRSSEDDDQLCKEYVTVSLHLPTEQRALRRREARKARQGSMIIAAPPRRSSIITRIQRSSFAVSHVRHLCISSFRSTSNPHHLPRAGQGGTRAACVYTRARTHTQRTSPKPL